MDLSIKPVKTSKDQIRQPKLSDLGVIPRLGSSSLLVGKSGCGKTTLAKEYIQMANEVAPLRNYFDLEDPTDLNRIQDPKVALEGLSGLIVIRDR